MSERIDTYDLDDWPDWRRLVADYGEDAEQLFMDRVPATSNMGPPMTADEARTILLRRHGKPI